MPDLFRHPPPKSGESILFMERAWPGEPPSAALTGDVIDGERVVAARVIENRGDGRLLVEARDGRDGVLAEIDTRPRREPKPSPFEQLVEAVVAAGGTGRSASQVARAWRTKLEARFPSHDAQAADHEPTPEERIAELESEVAALRTALDRVVHDAYDVLDVAADAALYPGLRQRQRLVRECKRLLATVKSTWAPYEEAK